MSIIEMQRHSAFGHVSTRLGITFTRSRRIIGRTATLDQATQLSLKIIPPFPSQGLDLGRITTLKTTSQNERKRSFKFENRAYDNYFDTF